MTEAQGRRGMDIEGLSADFCLKNCARKRDCGELRVVGSGSISEPHCYEPKKTSIRFVTRRNCQFVLRFLHFRGLYTQLLRPRTTCDLFPVSFSTTMDRFSLKGKRVLVTGASSGFGEHFARVCAAAGASIVIGARRTDRLETLKKELLSRGTSVLAVALDVRSRESVVACYDAIEKSGPVADVIVNNAGECSRIRLRSSEMLTSTQFP
jgi:hypothetical protein